MPDGSTVLVDSSGNSLALNATGAEVWTLCDGRNSVEAICDALLDRYEATPEMVHESVVALLRTLSDSGFVEYAD